LTGGAPIPKIHQQRDKQTVNIISTKIRKTIYLLLLKPMLKFFYYSYPG
jgi:hypothetical protein